MPVAEAVRTHSFVKSLFAGVIDEEEQLRILGSETMPVAEIGDVRALEPRVSEELAHAPVLGKPFGEAELDRCLRVLIGSMPHPAGKRQAA